MNLNRLTPTQLTALVFCPYIFTLLTFPQLSAENTSAVMLGSGVSTFIQLLLLIPVIAISRHADGQSPCDTALKKSPAAGIAVTLAYMLYFLREAFVVVGDMGYYTEYFFPDSAARLVTPVCLALAGAYLACQRISVIGKTASAVLASLLAAIVVIVLSLMSRAEPSRLHLAFNGVPSAVMRCASAELSRCECPVLFSFLLPMLKKHDSKGTVLRYTILKFLAAQVIIGFTGMALGEAVHLVKVPVFTAVASADGGMIRRFDSFFIILWSVTAMVKLGLLVFCSARCLMLLGTRVQQFTANMLCAGIPLMCAMPMLFSYSWESIAYSAFSVLPPIILAAVIPMILLTVCKKEHKYEKNDLRTQPAQ